MMSIVDRETPPLVIFAGPWSVAEQKFRINSRRRQSNAEGIAKIEQYGLRSKQQPVSQGELI